MLSREGKMAEILVLPILIGTIGIGMFGGYLASRWVDKSLGKK